MNDAQNRPRREYTPKPRPSFDFDDGEQSGDGYSAAATSPSAYSAGNLNCVLGCQALPVKSAASNCSTLPTCLHLVAIMSAETDTDVSASL